MGQEMYEENEVKKAAGMLEEDQQGEDEDMEMRM